MKLNIFLATVFVILLCGSLCLVAFGPFYHSGYYYGLLLPFNPPSWHVPGESFWWAGWLDGKNDQHRLLGIDKHTI